VTKQRESSSVNLAAPASFLRPCRAALGAQNRNKIPEAQIRHIFEDGAKHKGFLLKRLIKDKGFEPIFKKKDEAVPLQAADLLAYETFVGIRSIFEKGVADFDDLRYPLRMLDEVPHRIDDWGTYSEKDLETFCLNARIPRRVPSMRKTSKV
jgi:hypothetical protein